MDNEMVALRILHILAGVLWAGGAVMTVWIVGPVLEASGPDVMKQVGPRLIKPLIIYVHATAITTIALGLLLINRTPGRGYDQLFQNGWGWAIGLGLIVSVVGLSFGSTGSFAMRKAIRIGSQLKGPPAPAVLAEMGMLRKRFKMFTRIGSVLVVVAVGTMAAARYV